MMKLLKYVLIITIWFNLTACGGNGGSAVSEFTIGGTVSGLNGTLVLNNNGADPVSINSNGAFTFSNTVASNGTYAVTVATQPTDQTCTVNNGSGTDVVANVSNITVTCATTAFTISGTASGLGSGQQVTLLNNGADPLTVSANGTFTFSTPVATGAGYLVSVGTQPVGSTCAVTDGSGNNVTANVGTVKLTCTPFTESVLWSFGGTGDGTLPFTAPVLASDGNFYGTLLNGGANSEGAIYKITPSGTESIFYSFTGGSDGGSPFGGLTLGRDGNFYGTTTIGGTNSKGTIYKITPTGTITVLYNFGDVTNDTHTVRTPMVEGSDGNFYGVGNSGGIGSNGGVFKVTPTGSYTLLHIFASSGDLTSPLASLVQGSDGNFYGETQDGGANGDGGVFKITPTGTETVLWSFGGTGDGINGNSNLVIGADGNFYGTCSGGGANGNGTFFKITPAGSETVLYSFGASGDGQTAYGNLVLAADGNFYGTSMLGGTHSQGTIFRITPTGEESVLWSFGGAGDGQQPFGGLVTGTDGHFYGTTDGGGSNNMGAFFRY
jgi:uncharacterized repeat protein (TIGR03803 family)